ncbi:hypothetical protein AAZX31_12G058900 [Glycine max]|uniref:ATP-dependent zinc metalloprotease FTSH 3, mitochondrial n=1 Tax=Glycine soja TaxID=3848 RepID=A0A445HLS6_GLYSO|nr:ATP-dependent zinc metalloprotease FTSH 3, mitochondrial-like isoform X2 [Glycine soja]RZB74552.1 ATP-dependent zinc metalloprotease FTSH 3, mitochondrial [Glycine soja]
MIFSRIARSVSSSSRARNLLHGDGRLGTHVGSPRTNACSEGAEGVLGFVRGYVSSARALSNGFVSNLPDFKSVAANPTIRRLFCSKAPKKENNSNANTEDSGNFQEAFIKQVKYLVTPLLLMGLFLTSFSFGPPEQNQISFQEFKNKLLEPGLVDHIVVSNKSVAKVYVRNTPLNQTDNEVAQGTQPAIGSGGQYKYYFNIGSVESFEEKLEEAQEALGIYSHDFVPVTYSFELGYREWIALASILLFLGFVTYISF